MGIYDSFPQLDMDMDTAKKVVLVVTAVVVVGLLGFMMLGQSSTGFNILGFLQSNPISTQLDGPINLSLGPDGLPIKTSTTLSVTIQNPENKSVSDVTIIVKPADDQALLVYPASRVIPVLDKTRSARFSIRPNPIQPALSGTYVIEVQAFIKGKEYIQLIELEVKTNEP